MVEPLEEEGPSVMAGTGLAPLPPVEPFEGRSVVLIGVSPPEVEQRGRQQEKNSRRSRLLLVQAEAHSSSSQRLCLRWTVSTVSRCCASWVVCTEDWAGQSRTAVRMGKKWSGQHLHSLPWDQGMS